MNFNSLVFPAPKPSYTAELLGNELIWIPNMKEPTKLNNSKQTSSKMNGKSKEIKQWNISNDDITNEIPLPNYMTPQASLSKRIVFKDYNTEFTNSNKNSNKNKSEGNYDPLLNSNNENYEEKDDDFKPKEIKDYHTKTFDESNAFSKYSSNEFRVSEKNNNGLLNNIHYIPCLLMECPSNPNPDLILLYFHGNGEDIFLAYELIEAIRNTLKVPNFPLNSFKISID